MAFEEYKRHLRELEQQQRERMRTFHSPFEQHTTQSYLHAPSTTPISSVPEPRLFQLSDVVGCADLGFAPLFYDEPTGDQEDGLASSQSLNSPADMYIDYNLGGIAT